MVIILFVASDWSSLYRWNADNILSLMSVSSNNSRQNKLVNAMSQSLTIELGMSCKRTMLSKKALATVVTK
jgi:hypothetical protein